MWAMSSNWQCGFDQNYFQRAQQNQRKSHKNDTRVNKANTEVVDVTVDWFQKAIFSSRHPNFPVRIVHLPSTGRSPFT